MARKKSSMKRVGKKTTKKSTTKTVKKVRRTPTKVSTVLEYEQVIAKANIQLEKAHAKEVTQCDKVVIRLQAQLDRAKAKQKLQREKKAAATQRLVDKPTQAAKNLVTRNRETLRLTNEAVKEIRAELKLAKLALTQAKTAQKKFIAFEKHRARFERDWMKSTLLRKRKPRKRTRKAVVMNSDLPTG